MTRLIIFAAMFGLCAPALAANWRERVADAGYRCFWIETLHATYPTWVVSPDPYYYFIPQYYPAYKWACALEKSHRRSSASRFRRGLALNWSDH